jgi:hypothetical protein
MIKLLSIVLGLTSSTLAISQISLFGGYSLKNDTYWYPIAFGNDSSPDEHAQINAGLLYRVKPNFEVGSQLGFLKKRGLNGDYIVSWGEHGGLTPYKHHSKRYTSRLYADIVTIKIEPTLILTRNNIFKTNSQIRFGFFHQIDIPFYQKVKRGLIIESTTYETYPNTYVSTYSEKPLTFDIFRVKTTSYTGISIAQDWFISNYFIQLKFSGFISWGSRFKAIVDLSNLGINNQDSVYSPIESDRRSIYGLGGELSLVFGWSDLDSKLFKKRRLNSSSKGSVN